MAAVPVDDHDVSPRNVPSFPFLEEVRNIRVDEAHPPTSNGDGMDFERCSALHNAIIKHTWSATGHELSDPPQTTWTQTEYSAPHTAEVESRLHPSVVEFLKRAYQFDEKDFNFFHYLTALQGAGDISMTFKENLDDPDHRNRFYTLYSTDQTHTMNPDGLM